MGGLLSICFNIDVEENSPTLEELLKSYDIKNGYSPAGTYIYGRFDTLQETTDWRINEE